MKRVMIYGTLGPSCADRATLERMFSEGLCGMRLNLSHTTLEDAAPLIERCRDAANACGTDCTLLIDLTGPEQRIGALPSPLRLEAGTEIEPDRILLPDAVRAALTDGRELLLDDGKILLKVQNNRLQVLRGGVLESRKSVAVCGVSLPSPALTETDRRHIRMAKRYGVTGVMQPFVRSAQDLKEVRAALFEAGADDLRLFAKVENLDGLNRLDELIPHCDEIVIARGDLGNAMPLWELPAAQKRIAAACLAAGRDFTVVTQMLDSMTHRPVPTRAEVSDVFNAVLDGAASVMVTGETATGDYPVEVIRYLVNTVREALEFQA